MEPSNPRSAACLAEKLLSLRKHLPKKLGAAEMDLVVASAVAHPAAAVQAKGGNARVVSLADKADLVMGKVTIVLATKREATITVAVAVVDLAVVAGRAKTVNPAVRKSLR